MKKYYAGKEVKDTRRSKRKPGIILVRIVVAPYVERGVRRTSKWIEVPEHLYRARVRFGK